jgi:hypothetical protein
MHSRSRLLRTCCSQLGERASSYTCTAITFACEALLLSILCVAKIENKFTIDLFFKYTIHDHAATMFVK